MSARDPRRRVLTEAERVLWSTVTASITPLHKTTDAPEAMRTGSTAGAAAMVRADAVPSAASSSLLPPLGRRTRSRIARGRLAIEARLDLHGLTQNQAHASLLRFLREASDRGNRLVLVITGKGRRASAEGNAGVLRYQLPRWLGLPEFRALVVGFEQAHAAHGGEGAFYVQVRRSRRRHESRP
ncbi:MAG: Smr/MutS family protein [Pseudolabrys sp.]|nr:Smr/MutS family protein [Pseudolabrys sp.]